MTTIAGPQTRRLLVREVMSAPVITVPPGASLWRAWSTMFELGLRHLIVTEAGHCVGVIDDRTLFSQWPMGPLALRRNTVDGLMRTRVSCTLPDADLAEVAEVMIADGVDAVPVIDEHGRILGILTGSDIAQAVARYGVSRPEPAEA